MPDNFTAAEKEVARIAYEQGLAWGHKLKAMADAGAGDIVPGQQIRLIVPIGDIAFSKYKLTTRLTMLLGTTQAGITSNAALVASNYRPLHRGKFGNKVWYDARPIG